MNEGDFKVDQGDSRWIILMTLNGQKSVLPITIGSLSLHEQTPPITQRCGKWIRRSFINMTTESHTVTLKITTADDGTFESVRLLRGRSSLSEDMLALLNKALQDSLVPAQPVQTTVAIGNDAEKMVLHHLLSISQVNSDFDVLDTSSQPGHGDIAVVYKMKCVCIEVKNYSKPVPIKEVDKFRKSLALEEYNAGIMIQMNRCGYARVAAIQSPIDLQYVDGKPAAYITMCNASVDLKLLYPILITIIKSIDSPCDSTRLEAEAQRKALLCIYEQVSELRASIDAQKKALAKMEASVDVIAGLSCL